MSNFNFSSIDSFHPICITHVEVEQIALDSPEIELF